MENKQRTCGDCIFFVDTNWCKKAKIITYYYYDACSDFKPRKRVRKQFVRLKESGKKVYVKRFKEKLFIAEKEAIVDCERKIKYAGGFIGSYGELEVNEFIGKDKSTGKLYVFRYFPRRDLELAIAEVIEDEENLKTIKEELEKKGIKKLS